MIETVRIEPDAVGRVPTETLRREFPTVRICIGSERPPTRELLIEADDWATATLDFDRLDALVDDNVSGEPAGFAVVGSGAAAEVCAIELLTRCQRWIDRRNAESAGPTFDRLLIRHQSMSDLSSPSGRAAYRQALDTWQWVLRLEANASLSVQSAALFLGLGRTASSPAARLDWVFQAGLAPSAAARAEEAISLSGISPIVAERARTLVETHESPGSDCAARTLAAAAALSFVSLANPERLDAVGPSRTRQALRQALTRLSPVHRRHLGRMRLRDDFAALLREETGLAARGRAYRIVAVPTEDAVA